MSVSFLPEWKQLLLEKKRRGEEERERREKEEEQKFASMPAWKRGIIQRRKARQESLGDKEKDREVGLLQVDVRSPSEGLSDTDSSITVNMGSEPSLSPDPGLWVLSDSKQGNQVSLETIVPVHENPFIRIQTTFKKEKDADAEKGNEWEVKEREKTSPRGPDGEPATGRDIELKIERFQDLSEGRGKERSRDRSQGRERAASRDRNDGRMKDREFLKVRKDEEEEEAHPPSPVFSPLGPRLRTIRAENIIIIEQDSKSSHDMRGRWREAERERTEEDHQAKGEMKMDLREILAVGGSVTEIRASEVLIIKPSASPKERNPGGGEGREDVEMKSKEFRTDMSWLREKVKERLWSQATVIKEGRKDSWDDNVFVEKGGRVSQLLSKFGEHPKPPSRSKSSDNFMGPGRRKYSGDEDDDNDEYFEERRAYGWNVETKRVPKRSFSFSDRIICGKKNGLDEDVRRTRERIHSDKSGTSVVKDSTAKIKMGCARLLEKDRVWKHRDVQNKEDRVRHDRNEVKKVEVDKRAVEKAADAEGDKGFTVASVKNTEGISFARRVPIRQDGKARAEREVKRKTGDKDTESGIQICEKKDGLEYKITPETVQKNVILDTADTNQHYRQESAFTVSSSLLCTVPDTSRDLRNGPQGSHLSHSVLSQHTEELISKIGRIGDATIYNAERKERQHKAAYEVTEESNRDIPSDTGSDVSESPKSASHMGIPPGPLEIQIPRTVFYVAEEMVDKKNVDEGQEWEGDRGIVKRDSWRIGKPLSRIESLREKIRQRELEKLRQKENPGGGKVEDAAVCDNSTAAEENGTEAEKEGEATAHMGKRLVEAEAAQEEVAGQTSMAEIDVTQEVLKTRRQLPVSVTEAIRGEELTNAAAAASVSEVYSDCVQISDNEDDPLEHVVEELERHRQNASREDEKKEDFSEEDEKEELAQDSEQSLTPSPPHPNSLAEMSRIYNLEAVRSRSGLCVRERPVDIPSVHLVKVKPLISQQENSSGIQTIQRQIEHFQLKEQEVLNSQNAVCTSPLRDRETKGQQSPRGVLKQVKEDDKTHEMPELSPKVCSPTSQLNQNQTVASSLRSQSPENSLKPFDSAPTPASSPCSPSPNQSPSLSPSPSPSPILFSIRSASGGQVKRGATITIIPKRSAGGGGVTGAKPAASTAIKTPSQPVQKAPTGTEPTKKKYPTVDEIVVIGGYVHLEKPCLVTNRGMSKRVKVCFSEDHLEQMCEYPSETSMLACSLFLRDEGSTAMQQAGEEQDEDVESGSNVAKTSGNVGTATGRGVRVGQCHPLLKKHSV